MTAWTHTPALILIAALAATGAQAHETRTAQSRAMVALDMPELAPARRLMADLRPAAAHHPRIRHAEVMPVVPSRMVLPFLNFRWFGTPRATRNWTRCETIVAPFGGRISSCDATAPRASASRAMPRHDRSESPARVQLRALMRETHLH